MMFSTTFSMTYPDRYPNVTWTARTGTTNLRRWDDGTAPVAAVVPPQPSKDSGGNALVVP